MISSKRISIDQIESSSLTHIQTFNAFTSSYNTGSFTGSFTGSSFMSAGTEGNSIAPLIVRNTIPYQSPFTQFIQIWQNNLNQNILTLRVDGSLTLTGTNSTYNSSFFLSNNNGNGTSLLTFARGNNGFWFPDGNKIGFNTSGSERMRIDSTGQVVIGATTGSARLDVRAQGALSTDIAFRVRNSADTANLMSVDGSGITTITNLRAGTVPARPGFFVNVQNIACNQELNVVTTALIGLNGTINSSAQLQVDSTTRGFLPPRMTNTQRLAIASPAAGLIVYDTTDNKQYGYDGTSWASNLTNTGSQSITGQLNILPISSSSTAAIITSGSGTVGGVEYIDFLKVTNTAAGATNINTTFRKNLTGDIQMVNSTYTNTILSIDNSGSITTQGNITMPNRPAFRVIGTGGSIAATTTISGSAVTVDFNQGSHYNQTTGKFTAPIAGLYQVNVVCRTATNNNAGINQIIVRKQLSGGGATTAQIMLEWAANTSVNHMGGSTISNLAVGDTLWVDVTAGSISFDGNDNFSAAYIG